MRGSKHSGPDASRIVVGDQLRHRDHKLLASFELFEQRVAHAAGSGFMRRARGVASSSSATTAARTSSGAPGLSSTGPHAQPSRYASMLVDPSFIAKASIATW